MHASLRSAGRSRAAASASRPTKSPLDRKSTRLNSSHANTSYAVFCLKKKIANSLSLLLQRPGTHLAAFLNSLPTLSVVAPWLKNQGFAAYHSFPRLKPASKVDHAYTH